MDFSINKPVHNGISWLIYYPQATNLLEETSDNRET